MEKISLCTVCMNRLPHLAKTLPVNIAENSDYPNLEFVVLNYNSKDEMDDWMKTHMRKYISTGLVKYYRTTEPEFFRMAHSKNMCAKLATGDIICNMDADNYAGPGYANWVQKCFEEQGSDTLITTIRNDAIPYPDQAGKMCFSKDIFNAVNGYDESFLGYGMEDVDLINRLENAGAKRVFIEEEKYLRYIAHSDQERFAHHRYPNNLKNIFQCLSDRPADKLKFLYFFKDKTAAEVCYRFNKSIASNFVLTFLGWTIDDNGYRTASFNQIEDRLTLSFSDNSVTVYHLEDGLLRPLDSPDPGWEELRKDDKRYLPVQMGFNECLNRQKYMDNDRLITTINGQGWGQGNISQILV
jgi:GT2 family glycosyltransferase